MCKGDHIIGIHWPAFGGAFSPEFGAALSGLKYLRYLNIADNGLTKLSDSICSCKQLSALNFGKNNLNTLPACIISSFPLVHLILRENNLLPCPEISFTKYLRTFRSPGNSLGLKKLPDMKQLTQLQIFDVSFNPDLEDSFSSLTIHPELREIDISGTKIKFESNTFDNLPSLIKISMNQMFPSESDLSRSILPSFDGSMNIQRINFSKNYFQGPLPSTWSSFQNFQRFDTDIEHFQLTSLPSYLTVSQSIFKLSTSECKKLYWTISEKIFPFIGYECKCTPPFGGKFPFCDAV
jgi:Leucine-rich repeat (LRR) protein